MTDWAQYEGKIGTDPRTGRKFLVQGGRPVLLSPADPRAKPLQLTEDQGKSVGYASLMSEAEKQYQAARAGGYNPTDLRNSAASVLEGLPFGGLDGLAAVVRNDVGDRGRAAELAFADAQLKALSGAAAPEAEVKRNVRTLFARPGENAAAVDPQRRAMRETAYGAARTRSGFGAAQVPALPAAAGSGGRRLSPQEAAALPPGTPFIGLDGQPRVRR